eukprot:2216421-Prorocentrum_lima.AAC.1
MLDVAKKKHCDDSLDDGVSRFGHRLREIAVRSMVATTAADRAKRALQFQTRTSVQAVNHQIDDQ